MGSWKPSYEGIGRMLSSPEMQAEMHRRAGLIADAARAMAPVGPAKDAELEHYKEAFTVSSEVRTEPTRRAIGQVSNDSEHAAAIEFGNYRTRKQTIEAHHILGRAIDAARD